MKNRRHLNALQHSSERRRGQDINEAIKNTMKNGKCLRNGPKLSSNNFYCRYTFIQWLVFLNIFLRFLGIIFSIMQTCFMIYLYPQRPSRAFLLFLRLMDWSFQRVFHDLCILSFIRYIERRYKSSRSTTQ